MQSKKILISEKNGRDKKEQELYLGLEVHTKDGRDKI